MLKYVYSRSEIFYGTRYVMLRTNPIESYFCPLTIKMDTRSHISYSVQENNFKIQYVVNQFQITKIVLIFDSRVCKTRIRIST